MKLLHLPRCCMMEVYTGLPLAFTTTKKGKFFYGQYVSRTGTFHGQVVHQTKGQICSVLNSDKKELKTVALLVQHQSNNIDYGVFPLEFVHYILSEKETPVEVNFDTSKMRMHLLHCLVENELYQFLRSNGNHRKCIFNLFHQNTYFTIFHMWRQRPCHTCHNSLQQQFTIRNR